VIDRRTDNYEAQRGREHIIYEKYPEARFVFGGLNKIRAIRPNHPKLEDYLKAAKELE
tara:strand:+ start:1659 stop:1832 length:174 start_codon:yes stop_codon:yes gene_type:complete